MKIKFYSQKKIQTDILHIIGKYLHLQKYKVFFFGSRVNGKASERSDNEKLRRRAGFHNFFGFI